jgi:hypothetical protein
MSRRRFYRHFASAVGNGVCETRGGCRIVTPRKSHSPANDTRCAILPRLAGL